MSDATKIKEAEKYEVSLDETYDDYRARWVDVISEGVNHPRLLERDEWTVLLKALKKNYVNHVIKQKYPHLTTPAQNVRKDHLGRRMDKEMAAYVDIARDEFPGRGSSVGTSAIPFSHTENLNNLNARFEAVRDDMDVDEEDNSSPRVSNTSESHNPNMQTPLKRGRVDFEDDVGATPTHTRFDDEGNPTPSKAGRTRVPIAPYPQAAKLTQQQIEAAREWRQSLPEMFRKEVGWQIRQEREHPIGKWGRAYYQRGTDENLARYGKYWGKATAEQKARRDKDFYVGRGAYNNTGYSAAGRGRYSVRQFRHDARSLLGGRILGAVQNRLANTISGQGAYGMDDDGSENQLINKLGPSRLMSTSENETNSIRIKHMEYIGDVTPTAGGFQTQYFLAINPGLAGSFPWLSNLAQFYEEYRLVQCIFFFKSMVTEGNSSAGGNIIMATQYNPTNPAFQSKQVMENYDYANSGKVTQEMRHGVECDPSKKGGSDIEYVRVGAISSNQDLKTYDLGTFQLATNGAIANQNLGELWVEYEVELYTPKQVVPAVIVPVNKYIRGSITPGTSGTLFNHISGVTKNDDFVLPTATSIQWPLGVTSGVYRLLLFYNTVTVVTSFDPTTHPFSVGVTSKPNALFGYVADVFGLSNQIGVNMTCYSTWVVNTSPSVRASLFIGALLNSLVITDGYFFLEQIADV
jgi:hypothetical protein